MKNIDKALSAASFTLYFVCGAPFLESGKFSNKLCICFIISLNVIVFIFGMGNSCYGDDH